MKWYENKIFSEPKIESLWMNELHYFLDFVYHLSVEWSI